MNASLRLLKLQDLDLNGKRVLIREDMNVPLLDGKITNTARIEATLPTIKMALEKGARVILMSHLGRPVEGVEACDQPEYSLAPVAECLSTYLGFAVPLIDSYLEGLNEDIFADTQLVLLENVRFNLGEAKNSEALAKKLASLCDVFVMDAFATAHRAQASTEGVIRQASLACAGPLLVKELKALDQALASPAKPMVAIVGGSKVSTKLQLLESLAQLTDTLMVGGGIANTFIAASGIDVGASMVEPDLLETAKRIMEKTSIPLPKDVVVAKKLPHKRSGEKVEKDLPCFVKKLDELESDDIILDLGPATMAEISELISEAGTLIWNGPVGMFEIPEFASGTCRLAKSIAASNCFSLAGGGDTLAAIDQFHVRDNISYISTGGGAFLEFVEGKTLPAVAALESRYAQKQNL